MKLPDFLKELNQGAEKAFGEHAQAMIDSLLYAKLNGLEEGADIPVPTMSTAQTATRPGTGLHSSGVDPGTSCYYCKKPGHVEDDCQNSNERRNKTQ